jgi:hypothetical protein
MQREATTKAAATQPEQDTKQVLPGKNSSLKGI